MTAHDCLLVSFHVLRELVRGQLLTALTPQVWALIKNTANVQTQPYPPFGAAGSTIATFAMASWRHSFGVAARASASRCSRGTGE
jgi:hypothetical protein